MEEQTVEFLVEFQSHIPEKASESEIKARYTAEAEASAQLAREGHLIRLWRPLVEPGERKALGLYRASTQAKLDGLLGALPLHDWMQVTVTPLESHPSDPG